MEKKNHTVADKTIKGPVGKSFTEVLINVPDTPLNIPNTPDRMTMICSRSVQYLAETAGVISKDAINTTPTAWIPITTAATISIMMK